MTPHRFNDDGIVDAYTKESGCTDCPLPKANAIHKPPEQTPEAAEIDARILGEHERGQE